MSCDLRKQYFLCAKLFQHSDKGGISMSNTAVNHQTTTVTLQNGMQMPVLGFGTFRLRSGEEAYQSVLNALSIGYRHIDTAAAYENESDVGKAVRDSGVPRESIWVTTKLWNSDHGRQQSRDAFYQSLDRLKLEYIDCYLIHWPEKGKLEETWETMVTLAETSDCRSIGVSNFFPSDIENIVQATQVTPVVNQIEFNLHVAPFDIQHWCENRGIHIQAYTPLGRGAVFGEPLVRELCEKYRKKPCQIALRWLIQHNMIVLPKAAKRVHAEENADIFDFTLVDEDMQNLDEPAKRKSNRHT